MMDSTMLTELLRLLGLPGLMIFVLILVYRQSIEDRKLAGAERKEITEQYLTFLSEHTHKDLEADERIVVKLAEMAALQAVVNSQRQQEHQQTAHALETMEQHLVDAMGKMTRREQ